jgi:hypothetical protein
LHSPLTFPVAELQMIELAGYLKEFEVVACSSVLRNHLPPRVETLSKSLQEWCRTLEARSEQRTARMDIRATKGAIHGSGYKTTDAIRYVDRCELYDKNGYDLSYSLCTISTH